jgi:hypothetical protein
MAAPAVTPKLSYGPWFEDKLVDVVGLYLHPPKKAEVLFMDEEGQIKALCPTRPSLPTAKERAVTMPRDFKRNGATTLLAALDVATGTVLGQDLPKHRHEEFLAYLRTIDRTVPKALQAHLILEKVCRGRVALNESSNTQTHHRAYRRSRIPPAVTGMPAPVDWRSLTWPWIVGDHLRGVFSRPWRLRACY